MCKPHLGNGFSGSSCFIDALDIYSVAPAPFIMPASCAHVCRDRATPQHAAQNKGLLCQSTFVEHKTAQQDPLQLGVQDIRQDKTPPVVRHMACGAPCNADPHQKRAKPIREVVNQCLQPSTLCQSIVGANWETTSQPEFQAPSCQ